MGPPPPPPPPPLLASGAVLPSRKWKTEDAPRRNNNPPPAPAKPTRPTVDATALQHAAARLRKTGYNEPIRGDIENLSDGRVDRPDQRVPDGDRAYRSQLQQLAGSTAGAEIPSAPTYSNTSRPLGDVHRDPNALSQFEQSREALLSNFNSSPSSHYSPINKFTSSTLNQYASKSPSPPSIRDDASYVSPYSSKYSYPKNFRSYHKDDDYFTSTASSTTAINNYGNNNNNSNKYGSRETIVQWSEPYDPSEKRRSQSPIRNARELIHEYSTTNYVTEIEQPPPPHPSHYQQKRQARDFLQNSLARQLRDEGLTESQKAANRNQTSALSTSSSTLPFDASRIVKESYNGDEVDHLVHQMRTKLNQRDTTAPSIVQYPRRQPNDNDLRSSVANYSATTTASTTSTRKIMNINICVGCGKEITGDQPGCNAMNQIFHVDCFKCGQCSKTLAGASFYNIDEKPTCESCYQSSLEKCTACNRPISDKLLRACGGVYHVNCFVCCSCKKSLDGIPFTLDKENNVHCVPCFHDKFAPRCAMCSKPIVPQDGEKESVRVVAMDKSFHVDCYKCEDCGLQLSSKLEGQGCYPIDNHLLCKTCNGNRLRVVNSA